MGAHIPLQKRKRLLDWLKCKQFQPAARLGGEILKEPDVRPEVEDAVATRHLDTVQQVRLLDEDLVIEGGGADLTLRGDTEIARVVSAVEMVDRVPDLQFGEARLTHQPDPAVPAHDAPLFENGADERADALHLRLQFHEPGDEFRQHTQLPKRETELVQAVN